tara:strand:- start:2956 stop:3741 length:786 start_codon:yes stop_codon:yes gene_type:complete
MGLSKSNAPEVLNFVMTGPVRCGASVIQSALANHPLIACHSSLLAEHDSERRRHHERYFGPSGTTPDWLVAGHISGEQYLTNKIFDNPLHGERVIGVTVLYPHLHAHDLWDYLANWCRRGDFCLVQIKRNPIACFVASEQERREAVSSSDSHSKYPLIQSPLQVDIEALVSFVRMHAATDEKVARICDDRLEIGYSELVSDYPTVISEVLSFLDLPSGRRLRKGKFLGGQGDFESKPAYWDYLQSRVPSDVRRYFEPEEFV